MALTLSEAQHLSNDVILQGVIETILHDRPMLAMLPFIPITGNGLTYNQESTAPTAAFYAVGDTWAESTPTTTQTTATLSIIGGDSDIDYYLARTRGNIQDLEAAYLQMKARAVADALEDAIINGQASGAATPDTGFVTTTKAFDGLAKLIPGDATGGATTVSQAVTMGTNGATVSLAKMDELIDMVLGGRPDVLLMHRRTRRALNVLSRNSGNPIEQSMNQFGQFVSMYNGIPIAVSDRISITQTQGSNTDCSTVYAARFGEGLFAGLSSVGAPSIIEVQNIGALETKDATRYRVKAYVSCALFGTKYAAKLIGVRA